MHKSSSKMTTEDKWKMIVMSYRDKIAGLEARIKYEQKTRYVLQ